MYRMRRGCALTITTAACIAALASCGGAHSEYCTTLTDNSEVSATLFAPAVPGTVDEETVQQRLDLLGEVEDSVPDELSEDFATWTAYLEEIKPLIGSQDPDELTAMINARDDEVKTAGDALFDHYTGTCMD